MVDVLTDPTLRFKIPITSAMFEDLQKAMLDPNSRYIVTHLAIRSDSAWAEVAMVRADA